MGVFLFHLLKELVITYSFFIRLSDKWMQCPWILAYWNNKTMKISKYLLFSLFFFLKWECLHLNSNGTGKFSSETKIPLLILISTGQAVRRKKWGVRGIQMKWAGWLLSVSEYEVINYLAFRKGISHTFSLNK